MMGSSGPQRAFTYFEKIRGALIDALGVDEETALVGRLDSPEWRVLGRQTVSVITPAGVRVYRSGEKVLL